MTNEKHPLAGGSPTGPRACGSFRNPFFRLTRVNLFLILVTLLSAGRLSAENWVLYASGTYDSNGGSIALEIWLDLDTAGRFRHTARMTSAPNMRGANDTEMRVTGTWNGSTSGYTQWSNHSNGTNVGQVFNQVYTGASAGTVLSFTCSTGYSGGSPLEDEFQTGDPTHTMGDPPDEPDYYADFRIPSNQGTEPVKVRFYQSGSLLTEITVGPGDAAQTLHLSAGVVEGEMITAVYAYGNKVMSEGGIITFEPDKEFEHAGGGMLVNDSEPPEPYQLLPMRDTYGILPENEPLDNPDPVTPQDTPTPTTAPTPQTPQAKPTRGAVGIPFGTPSGTGGATKEDIEASTNALANALDEVDENRQASDDATLDALNKTNAALGENAAANTAALNSLREELVTGRNKQLEASKKTTDAVTGLRSDVRAGNTTLGLIASTLGELETQNRAPDDDTIASKVAVLAQLANDANTTAREASEVLPEVGTVATDDATAGSGSPVVALPGNPSVTVSLNPLQNEHVQLLAGLLRALIGWSVVLGLVAWTYVQIPKWFTQALQGGSGITVWRTITGAVPLIGLAVFLTLMIAFGTVLFTAPTLLWAYADPLLLGASDTALVDMREIMDASGGPNAGIMISLLDACCPTGLCLTAFFNWIALQIGGQSIVAGLVALQKVLVSG